MTPAKQAELSPARPLQSGAPPARRTATVERGLPAHDAEPFWPAQLAAAAALALYLTLPHALIMGPKWLVPGVEGVLLLGLVITTPTRHHMQSSRLRSLIVGLVGLVSLTTLIALILLARFLLDAGFVDTALGFQMRRATVTALPVAAEQTEDVELEDDETTESA